MTPREEPAMGPMPPSSPLGTGWWQCGAPLLLALVLGLAAAGGEVAPAACGDITRDGGGLTASDEGNAGAQEGLAQLTDGKVQTKYLAFRNAVWIQYAAAQSYLVTSYSITSANDFPGRDPASWRFLGSDDGATWTTLDEQRGQVFPGRGLTRTFAFANRLPFSIYRLHITQAADPALGTLQLAELAIAGAEGRPLPPRPLSIASQPGDRNVFAAGARVVFSVQAAGGSGPLTYQWQRNGVGIPGATASIYTFAAEAADHQARYQVQIADARQATIASAPVTLSIQAPSPGDWTGFVPPAVECIDKAGTLAGSAIFHAAIPDPAALMQEQCLAICRELYADNRAPRNDFKNLRLVLEDAPKAVAWKSGNAPDITISVSAQYLERFFHANGRSHELVRQEVRGVLSHEGAHGYQWSPHGCGRYDGSSVYWGLVEGMADAVRAELTNWTPARHPRRGGNWNDGYTTCGFFLGWCKRNKKPTFIIDLNRAAQEMPAFTWDGAFRAILGAGVQEVWNEYQACL